MTHVLVVDDDPDQHLILRAYLEPAGFAVTSALDGVEVEELCAARRPDLVILDIEMPRLGGLETLQGLRRRGPTIEVPVILLTSVNEPAVKVRAFDVGASDYLVKPVDGDELVARVRSELRRARRACGAEGVLVGNLEDLDLPTLFQTIDRRAARVSLPDVAGELELADGALLAARFSEAAGQAALERLLLVGRGPFAVEFGEGAPRPSGGPEPRGVTDALLDAIVAVDECRAELDRLGGPGARVSLAEGPSPIGRPLPCRLDELVVALPGELSAATAEVLRLVSTGALRVERDEE